MCCDSFPRNEDGAFLDESAAFRHLKAIRPDLGNAAIVKIFDG